MNRIATRETLSLTRKFLLRCPLSCYLSFLQLATQLVPRATYCIAWPHVLDVSLIWHNLLVVGKVNEKHTQTLQNPIILYGSLLLL